ncbi:MAG: putative sugar nucleotidyl transferase [Planctomycetota bacterium]
MRVICFEDELVSQLSPITLSRPAYAIRCASFRWIDWLGELSRYHASMQLSGEVRSHLREIQTADYALDAAPLDLSEDAASQNGLLIVNARCSPSVQNFDSLRTMIQQDRPCLVREEGGWVIAAWLPRGPLQPGDYRAQLESALEELAVSESTMEMFQWPHHVVAAHMRQMHDSVSWRIADGDYQQREDGVFVRPGVTIGEHASIETSNGPILLEDDVRVGPFCFLEGPLHAGKRTRVIEHSSIKDGVSLGHTVKIGGEVEASIIEPYTNKQHHGFLGHSYLGSWINLGAGTCNSDLKNTYGRINITYGETKIPTEMQFLGCIMGDYSKTAINTGIFTGKVIGVCSMLYGFVTDNVPSYVNYARLFGQTSLLPPDVMINTQARMFARRKVKQRPCDINLIQSMYEMTEFERDAGDFEVR